jgi:hypothetical protein
VRGPNRRIIRSVATYDALSEEPPVLRALYALSLGETRRFLRESHARMMVVFFAILYALGSMVLGAMLIITPVRGGYTTEILWGNALGIGAWNYPGLLIVAPWGVVSLPFLATIAMVLVSIGVGIGVAVAILIAARLIRDRRGSAAHTGAVGSVAGLTPALIALVTLGACCSTTAAATAGVGLVAKASGSSINTLLVNDWYLDLFQISVVFVALLAQEMLLEVYGGLFGLAPEPGSAAAHRAPAIPAPLGPRSIAGGMLRAALLLAGVSWSLAMFAEWTTVAPASASAALWFQWIVQHQVLGGLAIAVALFPRPIVDGLRSAARAPRGVVLRAVPLVAGLSLLGWMPPVIAAAGAPGLVNELFGAGGLPSSWGAVPPVYPFGLDLLARWGFQYVLLGGFAVAFALAPGRALAPIDWTIGRGPGPTGSERSPSPTAPTVAGWTAAPPRATREVTNSGDASARSEAAARPAQP